MPVPIRKLAMGFLPLLAYIAAEALFGEIIGLAVGIAMGIAEFLFLLVRDRKADAFVVADTLFLAAMGALSLALRSPVFIRLKPAAVEAMTAAAMIVLARLPPAALKGYIGRQLGGLDLDGAALPAARRSLLGMAFLLALHAALTAWAAFAWSAAAWGFVSGGLLYIVLGGAAFLQWLVARRKAGRAAGGLPSSSARETGHAESAWCLFVADGEGSLYAARNGSPGAGGFLRWDAPARGRSRDRAGIESAIWTALSGLGVDPAAASSGGSISVASLFRMPSGSAGNERAGDSAAVPAPGFPETGSAPSPGGEIVLIATVPRAAFAGGADPTLRRFWPFRDLLAVRGKDLLESMFEEELAAFADLAASAPGKDPTAPE